LNVKNEPPQRKNREKTENMAGGIRLRYFGYFLLFLFNQPEEIHLRALPMHDRGNSGSNKFESLQGQIPHRRSF
jgi:hypothetical protein